MITFLLGFTLGTIFGVVSLVCVAIMYDKHHPEPEKKEYIVPNDNVESQKDIIAVGWNACLREITETSDENKR